MPLLEKWWNGIVLKQDSIGRKTIELETGLEKEAREERGRKNLNDGEGIGRM